MLNIYYTWLFTFYYSYRVCTLLKYFCIFLCLDLDQSKVVCLLRIFFNWFKSLINSRCFSWKCKHPGGIEIFGIWVVGYVRVFVMYLRCCLAVSNWFELGKIKLRLHNRNTRGCFFVWDVDELKNCCGCKWFEYVSWKIINIIIDWRLVCCLSCWDVLLHNLTKKIFQKIINNTVVQPLRFVPWHV